MSLRWLLWKDARTELRGKEGLQAGLVLVALFALLFLFLFEDLAADARAGAAVLWAPLLFAAAAASGRGLAAEGDRGTLELLRGAPVALGLHGVSRTLVNLVLAQAVAGAALLLGWGLFLLPVSASLVLVLAASAAGLAVVGTVAGALAAPARAREALLPILLVPAAAPLVQAGVAATLAALAGESVRTPLLLVLGYDVAAAGVAWLLWPVLMEAE